LTSKVVVPPGGFRLATSPTRDWVARDHEEGDELAPFHLIEVHSIRAGPALVCIELGVSMTAILLKNTLFSKLMSAPNFRPKRD
jgi:hypothetical protein